ncbi:MAG: response regulator transcription factor [Fluviicoccus sp.]|uniref:response regulator transcription factor n=1 Tax=Fluviicoccus sp. TaxID=2003552 RepID=UPI002728D6F7|nr:response regulator transcription factor [Fluviicoccus sp.]MDO8329530.1 response regulator transcription factor [Fluviicoccus sp.]
MIRVLVVDDQALVRRGIVALLGFEADIDVVGQASDGEECLALLPGLPVDVVLMDIRMPRMNGLEAVRQMRCCGLETPVVLLTTFDEPVTLAQGRSAGAQACLLKDIDQAGLVAVIRTVAAGGEVEPAGGRQPALFTRRELAVIRELCAGKQNKEIALALQLSAGTVRNYLSMILEKLEVRDRTQAILKLKALGLV